MKLGGHPIHPALVHFPTALFPMHWGFRLCGEWLPDGVGAVAGFWTLAAGVALGALAVAFGALDLVDLAEGKRPEALRRGLWHGGLNGSLWVAFALALWWEWQSYPDISYGAFALAAEGVALAALFLGNYLGASIIWGRGGLARPDGGTRSEP